MITEKDIHKMAKPFGLDSLIIDNLRAKDGSDSIYRIRNFWIVKFITHQNYDWSELMIGCVKTEDAYYGLLLLPKRHQEIIGGENLLPIRLAETGNVVFNVLHNFDLFTKYEPVGSWFEDISYDLITSSSNLEVHLEVKPSLDSRPSIDKLNKSLGMTMSELLEQYDNEKLTEIIITRKNK